MQTTPTSELYEVKPSSIHGQGVFALRDLPPDVRVLEYLGERVSKDEAARRLQGGNFFVFNVTDEFDLDGAVDWNPARFINHSCTPNCDALQEGERIWITTSRELRAGEELSFNYNYDLADYETHLCRCGAKECLGFMVAEEYFDDVRRKEQQKRGG